MTRGITGISDKCCINCNFLALVSPPDNWALLLEKTRDRLAMADEATLKKIAGRASMLSCFKGVWDAVNYRGDAPPVKEELHLPRGETCFFYPVTPGMILKVAAELEERAAAAREANKDRKLTRLAFLVALGALIVSILATAVNLGWNVFTHYYPGPANAQQAETLAEDQEPEGK